MDSFRYDSSMSQGWLNSAQPPPARDVGEAVVQIDRALTADRNYADLGDLLQVSKHNLTATVSGQQEMDYVSTVAKSGISTATGEWENMQRKPLPPELVEQFNHIHCNCMMGLFPEIGRAWLSVDSDIYVWNYEDGSDLAYFDGLSETILAVGLARPKPGVFLPHIRYLLCLATPVDIVILGVSFDSVSHNVADSMQQNPASVDTLYAEMHLLPEPIFVLPADGHITTIEATQSGRIFATGKDGCLYEIVYQSTDGWFSRKCRKVNHSKNALYYVLPAFLTSLSSDDGIAQLAVDDSRHMLYTLSEKGTLQLFDLGENGQTLSRVEQIPYRHVLQRAAIVTGSSESERFGSIVHIAAIPRSESIYIHLVAITSTGVRFYFITSPFSHDPNTRPNMLLLVSVRLAPSNVAGGRRPTKVHKAVSCRGTTVMCASIDENNDLLWTLSNDTFPFDQHLRETCETIPCDGQTWAIAAVPPLFGTSTSLPSSPAQQKADPPIIVSQTDQLPRRFVVLNSKGSYTMTKMGPADQLRKLLASNDVESPEVRAFFAQHRDQACAMCLVLVCSSETPSKHVKTAAATAFMKYGGVVTAASMDLQPGYIGTPGGLGMNVTRQLNFETPSVSRPFGGGVESGFSARHNGLYVFTSRVLRLLWDEKLVREVDVPNASGSTDHFLVNALHLDVVVETEARLSRLLAFLNGLPQFIAPPPESGFSIGGRLTHHGDDGSEASRQKRLTDIAAMEAESVRMVTQLITSALQCLALWCLLCEHQFHVVVSLLATDLKIQLRAMSFKVLVTSGREVVEGLINSLVRMYIDDAAATDAISARLREACPMFYSPEDVLMSKASETMQQARLTAAGSARTKRVEEALKVYKQVCLHIDLPKVCGELAAVQHYQGIVDLALVTASKRDPQNIALYYNRQPDDPRGQSLYAARRECYRCVLDALDFLLSCGQLPAQAASPVAPGPPRPDLRQMSATEADKHVSEMYDLIIGSDDELMHVALYDWLIEKRLSEKLLDIRSPYLEQYLQRKVTAWPDDQTSLDLMWKYYEKSGNFLAAARMLSKLSERYNPDVKLSQRVEYLSRAIVCAKTATSRAGGASGEFLFELEEKMEVARLQLQVSEALQQIGTDAAVKAVASLDAQLFDITTLYGDYAAPNGLAECKLAIVHCAGHFDVTLVEAIWQEIVDNDLKSTAGLDAAARAQHLSAKIAGLGAKYAASERYFPLANLTRTLELASCEFGFENVSRGYVINMMLRAGIPLHRLFAVYDRMNKAKDAAWRNLHRPYHLLRVTAVLFEMFIATPSLVSGGERRQFVSNSTDAITRYLVDLQADGRSTAEVTQLLKRLTEARAQLERML